MAGRRHRPWAALASRAERAVVDLMIGLVLAVVGRRLRKRFRGP